MKTIDEILKAVDDLSEEDKKKLHQTLSDRIDESVAADERDEGDEGKEEDAKDRIDESIGTEEYDEEKDEVEDGDDDAEDSDEGDEDSEADEVEEDLEKHEDEDKQTKDSLEARIARIEALLMKMVGEDKEKSSDVEEKAKEVYGLGGGTFAPEDGGKKAEKVNPLKVLRNIGL